MIVYGILVLVVLLLGLVARESVLRDNDASNVVLALVCVAYAFVACLRSSSVGADTEQYIEIFEFVQLLDFSEIPFVSSDEWWDSSGSGVEITYKIYNKIVSLICSHPQAITFANGLIVILALYRLVRAESSNYWLSAALFLFTGLFQTSMNMTPSMMCGMIVLGSVRYIREQKLLKFLVAIFVASWFHLSAFLLLPLYWLNLVQIKQNVFYVLLSVGIGVSLLFYGPIVGVLALIVPDSYAYYLESSTVRLEQLLVLGVFLLLLVVANATRGKGALCLEGITAFDLWVVLLVCVSYALAVNNTMFTRFAFLLSPYLVVTIANLLYAGESVGRMQGAAALPRFRRPSEAGAVVLVVLAVASYVGRLFVNNIGTTMPYEFFWM